MPTPTPPSPNPNSRSAVRLVSVTDARATLSHILANLRHEGERAKPVLIGRHGEPMAALISLEQFHDYCTLAALRRRQFAPQLPPPRLPPPARPLGGA